MTDVVQAQYERWVYPAPIHDLASAIPDAGDPMYLGHAYWPDRPLRTGMRILVAGCGTNAAARMAFFHRDATVVGIDVSSQSLKHSEFLKNKHGLDNLSLHQCRIEDARDLGETFDLIDAVGVLHHLRDPSAGLKVLAEILRRDGVIFLMLYAKYGRAGLYMAQNVFRMLGVEQTADDVAFVKQSINAFGQRHPLHQLLSMVGKKDLTHDAGIVDMFLHRQDRAYTVAECMDLLDPTGLVFQGWLSNFLYYPEGQMSEDQPLRQRIQDLEDGKIWPIMELVHGRISKHCFFACRRDRDPSTYAIDFASGGFLDMVPIKRPFHKGARDESGALTLEHLVLPRITLSGTWAELAESIDGKKPVRDYGAEYASFFRMLWRIGYIFLVYPSALRN